MENYTSLIEFRTIGVNVLRKFGLVSLTIYYVLSWKGRKKSKFEAKQVFWRRKNLLVMMNHDDHYLDMAVANFCVLLFFLHFLIIPVIWPMFKKRDFFATWLQTHTFFVLPISRQKKSNYGHCQTFLSKCIFVLSWIIFVSLV